MNDIAGCNVITWATSHPYLVAGSAVYWDAAWQIPVYDEGRWVVGSISSTGSYHRIALNGEIPTWPRAIVEQICKRLSEAGAYGDDVRDNLENTNIHSVWCLKNAFDKFSAWRGRTDADYEASGSQL